MLCDKYCNIDFSEAELCPNSAPQHSYFGDDDNDEGHEYYVSPHHFSLWSLFDASNAGCHLCRQIRRELFHIRSHESDEFHHHGPLEIRQYIKNGKEKLSYPTGLQIVAKTPMRDVKVSMDLVQFLRRLRSRPTSTHID